MFARRTFLRGALEDAARFLGFTGPRERLRVRRRDLAVASCAFVGSPQPSHRVARTAEGDVEKVAEVVRVPRVSRRALDGAMVGRSLHRIEESLLRREVEAAGFKLVAEAEFLRQPSDTRDFNVQRPTGPVDEFVLKFEKPR